MKKNVVLLMICCGVLLMAVSAVAATGNGGQASLTVTCGTNTSCNATNTSWTLTKCDTDPLTGNCVPNFTTVPMPATLTWKVVATSTGTTHKILTINGSLSVTNTGSAPATIGSIVLNLQKFVQFKVKNQTNGYWVSASADIADARWGDLSSSPYNAATPQAPACALTAVGGQDIRCADIVAAGSAEDPTVNAGFNTPATYNVSGTKGTFRENAASGPLSFTDANSNTIFSLNPQQTIAVGQTVALNYSAQFDNTVLGLADGTPIRAEALVSFGNSGTRGNGGASANNIDVNGNGKIDNDEANVRTVPCRWTTTVPYSQSDNSITDLLDRDQTIATSNSAPTLFGWVGGEPVFTFGDGFVPINTSALEDTSIFYNAYTTSIGGNNNPPTPGTETLTTPASATETVGVTVPDQPNALAFANCATLTENAATLNNGCNVPVSLQACAWPVLTSSPPPPNYCTVTPGGWQAPPSGNNPGTWLTNYFTTVYTSGQVVIGGNLTDTFKSAAAIQYFEHNNHGTPAALTGSSTYPPNGTDSSKTFGAQVLALQLNVDFSKAGVTPAGLVNEVYTSVPAGGCEDGKNVQEILDDANIALGGGAVPAGCTISTLNDVVAAINGNPATDNGQSPTACVGVPLIQPKP